MVTIRGQNNNIEIETVKNAVKSLKKALKDKNVITDADLINAKTTLKKKTKKWIIKTLKNI